MAARRLFGATGSWARWRAWELPDPAGSVRLHVRDYAKRPVFKGGKGAKGAAVGETLKDPEVCTDPVQLTTHPMGVNIYKEGQDVVLKPDSEYPEWLFQMNVGPPKKLEELDPETREYWRLLRKHNIWRHNRLSKNQKF
ncbi:large ribosomal subunit protein mL54 precursor [Bos taurus]|uniref:Large ribosomal subunit protein mL54 n=1 Tax=Bos taurus TaxID=9913 RepID=RM54_BOVIN|nr:large ribosomal subunit protein mL54 precursor [Bos taurus]Q3MHJ5.1 RecName: Full=Large ribosomal subunit protein mL54; AltName: Full=39S ribosomal protein L54, mitochondrial; Short=L54mt; Short=MRP-L54; Flags: Precursor [Bos taurus]AAI05216.1 Mitochondrial ribosomal protein L54 [Bos taurus]